MPFQPDAYEEGGFQLLGNGGSTEILRPNGVGDYTNINFCFPDEGEEHWEDVDEAVADDEATWVCANSESQLKDAYHLEATSIPAGSTINSVKVYFRGWTHEAFYFQPFLRLGGVETAGTEINPNDQAWATYSEILARPGGGNWAVSDLADLQVAIGLRGEEVGCTQIYVEIDYTEIVLFEQAVGDGSVSIAGVVNLLTKISIGAGAVAIAGALGLLTKKSVGAGTMAIVGSLATILRFVQSVGNGAVVIAGTLSTIKKMFQAVGSGSVSIAGTLGRLIKIGIGAGSVAIAGALNLKTLIPVGSGAVTMVGSLGRLIKITLTGAVTIAGSLDRLIKIGVGGASMTITGALSASRKFLQSVGGGTITPFSTLVRNCLFSLTRKPRGHRGGGGHLSF